MSWNTDIREWALANDRDPYRVEKICIRKGWDPLRYSPQMRDDLIDWLDQWYTLSIKKLPQPATLSQCRRNPEEFGDTAVRDAERAYEESHSLAAERQLVTAWIRRGAFNPQHPLHIEMLSTHAQRKGYNRGLQRYIQAASQAWYQILRDNLNKFLREMGYNIIISAHQSLPETGARSSSLIRLPVHVLELVDLQYAPRSPGIYGLMEGQLPYVDPNAPLWRDVTAALNVAIGSCITIFNQSHFGALPPYDWYDRTATELNGDFPRSQPRRLPINIAKPFDAAVAYQALTYVAQPDIAVLRSKELESY